jgi:hypothetical protein
MKALNVEIGEKFNKLTLLEKMNTPRPDGQTEIRGLFKCECGEKRTVLLCAVTNGKFKSCGCYKPNRLEPGESAFNALLRDYKWGARRSHRSFELTTEHFRLLTINPCHYCGTLPNQIYTLRRGHGSYIYNGVDRVNNEIGYTTENCVTCCKMCNLCKGVLSKNDFINQVVRIYKHSALL